MVSSPFGFGCLFSFLPIFARPLYHFQMFRLVPSPSHLLIRGSGSLGSLNSKGHMKVTP